MIRVEKAVIVFSGGIDSACCAAMLGKRYGLHGISFSYGQKAGREVRAARALAKRLGLKEHRVVDIGFMKGLYGDSNALTSKRRGVPGSFDYSIVVPVRNAVFLAVASAWAYALGASLVAYGAHTGDRHYPDCRPPFARKLASALNRGEADGIKAGLRRGLEIWSPYAEGLSKSDLLKRGHGILGDSVFGAWSCYLDGRLHCGACESCNNRKAAFARAGIADKTRYME